jgi:ATP-binding cassette subfamily B protein/subfamily B ATP-binding cassette protein MsbA
VSALVGGSGAGKSTIADLLLRLFDPTSGQILVDTVPLSEYSLASWRRHLGVVSQDTFLFTTSVRENIRFGLPEASDTDVEEAARLANADTFIRSLPQGYETVVGEAGHGLSGGQRQRIALARAILRRPDILILDEATSALDSASERLIQEALDAFSRQRTVVIIAHRLSTISQANQILLVEDGRILERGSHHELLRLDGRYARYWSIQSSAPTADVS